MATALALRLNNSSARAVAIRPAHAERREQPEGDDGLATALELAHAGGHAFETAQRIRLADRQVEEDQAKVIAEFLGVFERTQVDRHRRANGQAIDIVAEIAQVAADRTGRAGEQHVVDRTTERLAERFHFIERQRLGPGDALDQAELAAQLRDRVVREGQGDAEFARDLAAFVRDRGGDGGIGQHLGELGPGFFTGRQHLLQAALHRFEQAFEHQAAIALQPGAGEFRTGFGLRCSIGQRKQHLHQGEAIGVAMVDARDKHAAAAFRET